jgi:hypothetical protein
MDKLREMNIDLDMPLEQLGCAYEFWHLRQDRVARQASVKIAGLRNELLVMADDFVAVAMCARKEKLLAASYASALDEKRRIREMTDPRRPIGQIISELIKFVDERLVEIATMRETSRMRTAS